MSSILFIDFKILPTPTPITTTLHFTYLFAKTR